MGCHELKDMAHADGGTDNSGSAPCNAGRPLLKGACVKLFYRLKRILPLIRVALVVVLMLIIMMRDMRV